MSETDIITFTTRKREAEFTIPASEIPHYPLLQRLIPEYPAAVRQACSLNLQRQATLNLNREDVERLQNLFRVIENLPKRSWLQSQELSQDDAQFAGRLRALIGKQSNEVLLL
jgi:hypothetical protein